MAEITNSIPDFKMIINEKFVKTAEQIEPKLYSDYRKPNYIVTLEKIEDNWAIKTRTPVESIKDKRMKKDDSICYDFGNHYVGYVSFHILPCGSPPDAPAHIRIKLGEVLCEIGEDSSAYKGTLSSSWIQEEFLHIDTLPAKITLPRRYAFRYLELKVLDTSPKYQVKFEDICCTAVTSGDRNQVEELPDSLEPRLKKIDQVALKTMEGCMHSVFEDGPKRNRRLWLGDLRLQAITNYETFKNYDLVKRCLYLFAGLTQNEGSVGACLFLKPTLLVDDTFLFDYSLLFISCLYDYYIATKDEVTLRELWDTAFHQIELAEKRIDLNGVVKDSDDWWCFIDWNDKLNKQASAQGVLIYTLKQAQKLSYIMNNVTQNDYINNLIEITTVGAKEYLWNEKYGLFISGAEKQISWASQIWLILADIYPKEKNQHILKALIQENPKIDIVTPYLYHHFIEALIQNGLKELALEHLYLYWGGMVEEGADCFWELYNPKQKNISPYGSSVINSYCHAWSCTPSYFIRKYYC